MGKAESVVKQSRLNGILKTLVFSHQRSS